LSAASHRRKHAYSNDWFFKSIKVQDELVDVLVSYLT